MAHTIELIGKADPELAAALIKSGIVKQVNEQLIYLVIEDQNNN